MISALWSLLAAFAVILTLQGCGGGGGGQTTTTTTTQGWPIEPHFPRTPFMADSDAVKYLNAQITGFDLNDKTSPLGLTITMAAQPKTFFGNIFCSTFRNPLKNTGCFGGQADCRWSASLYNSKIWYNQKTGRVIMGMDREVGIVFNQTGVENEWNKCSYLFDGASAAKYNRGCGPGARSTSCDSENCAFHDINPDTNEVCKADDALIKTEFCTKFGGQFDFPEARDKGTQCVIPGTAIDYHDQPMEEYKPRDNNLRAMVEERYKLRNGKDRAGNPNCETWNEIVLDQMLLLPKLIEDPANVITAIIHRKSNAGTSRNDAMKLVNEFTKLAMTGDKNQVPLVMFDDTTEDPDAPIFVLSQPTSESVNAVV
jgi:hypothetical protein